MKDLNGFYVDVSQPDVPLERDVAAIRMNVDDFDTAYQLLLSKGFRNYYGERIVEPPHLQVRPDDRALRLFYQSHPPYQEIRQPQAGHCEAGGIIRLSLSRAISPAFMA